MMETPPLPLPQPEASAGTPGERRYSSRDLFGDTREIVIEHAGRHYRMRITQNGKLILTA